MLKRTTTPRRILRPALIAGAGVLFVAIGFGAWYQGYLRRKTHEVGTKRPNAWGLYDMHGNVWEWCLDRYVENYYENSLRVNPLPPPHAGKDVVLRGGSWYNTPRNCRSASRNWDAPDGTNDSSGFRVARTRKP